MSKKSLRTLRLKLLDKNFCAFCGSLHFQNSLHLLSEDKRKNAPQNKNPKP